MFVPEVILEALSLWVSWFCPLDTSLYLLLFITFPFLQSSVPEWSKGHLHWYTMVLLSTGACGLVCSAFDFLLSTLNSPHWGISALSKPVE